ncbi:bifunctional nuclease domain-containing protein [Pseudonocardia humida]|uniref:Bifunctional nuclease family protein n=1 Tax=Pseudonocardia humida TaxID=2800819 RepID=A0ABT0ZV55_9PSEU|nr:bifunctional nuclease domain-containing protein [Pseudonocardia humida]MCO1654622.1 bifunctional nuclease family protein [Pseudonocardia humida]
MRLVMVGVDAVSGRPVLLFEEVGGAARLLRMEVGPVRARAIEAAWRGERVEPATLGLLGLLRAAVGHRPVRVVIGAGAAGRWAATVLLDGGGQVLTDPPDAVLLALADRVPIMAEDDLLSPAGTGAAGLAPEPTPAQREQLHRFRRFLADVVPDDFRV